MAARAVPGTENVICRGFDCLVLLILCRKPTGRDDDQPATYEQRKTPFQPAYTLVMMGVRREFHKKTPTPVRWSFFNFPTHAKRMTTFFFTDLFQRLFGKPLPYQIQSLPQKFTTSFIKARLVERKEQQICL